MLGYIGVLAQQTAPEAPPIYSKLAALRLYWEERSSGGSLPGRRFFGAKRMIPWLPHLSLIEVERETQRFKIRLMGAACIRYARGDFTGKWIDECAAKSDPDAISAPYRDCVLRRAPIHADAYHIGRDGKRRSVHRLLLPCSNDGLNVDLIVLGAYVMQPALGAADSEMPEPAAKSA